ncbi:hypothetical protein ACFQHO_38300 [Actinomadura yumaensis]|uniref:hypothetical protein n=1 Tax=Actinomadura yumaensis TaxID=111807 RepID=UPI003615BA91
MTRARTFGLPLPGTPGPHNAITDVPGVEVGYTTLIEGTARCAPGADPSGPASRRCCRAAGPARRPRARPGRTR